MRPYLLIFVFFNLTSHLFAQSRLGESQITQTERRMALAIGMDDYEYISPLKNPSNDADDMAATLESLGFTVTKIKNQKNGEVTASINKFVNSLRGNDVVLIYFSGHGIGYLDDNFLLPKDAKVECLEQISAYSISVKRLSADIQSKRVRNNFIILDACRSLGNLSVCNDSQSGRDILINKGLVIPQNQASGNVIVYATQAGKTADDNQKRRNGLFTQELLKNIIIPNISFGTILTRTASGVLTESQNQQEPTLYGLRGTEFVFIKKMNEDGNRQSNDSKKEDLYLKGKLLIDQKKYKESLFYLKEASNTGNSDAQNLIGWLYDSGLGVSIDHNEAIRWFVKSANLGNVQAQKNLGDIYFDGKIVQQDYYEAFKWYKVAAEKGLSSAQANLGSMYFYGKGINIDYNEALIWFRLAAKQGDPSGYWWLGTMYEGGYGVKQDYFEAFKNYQNSADQGDSSAEDALGNMYEKGFGVKQDLEEAKRWYQKSADHGDAFGQFSLGLFYYSGKEKGIPDFYKANDWVYKSALQGTVVSQQLLGEMYEKGEGCMKSKKLAKIWYEKAAAQGNVYAIERLKVLK